jgi:hypothetical protein
MNTLDNLPRAAGRSTQARTDEAMRALTPKGD